MLRLFQTALAAGIDLNRDVVVLPVGKWHTDKYGDVDISPELCDELIANFNAKVLGRDIRVDIGHAFAEAAGWITALGYGTFADPVNNETCKALVMRVDWTSRGTTALSEGEYRYVSAAFGRYTDPATGKVYANVMRAVSLTNDPVMRVPAVDEAPASVEFSELVTLSDAMNLGEVVDALDKCETPPQLQEAAWSTWEALSAFETLVRQAISEGMTGDALRARIAELATDLPAAIEKVVSEEVAEENAEDAAEAQGIKPPQIDPFNDGAQLADSGSDPVKELLASYDDLMSKCDEIVGGTAGVRAMRTLASETRKKLADLLTKKGGTTDMSELETKLAAERDALQAKLDGYALAERTRKVDAALDTLSDKGMTEPARKALGAIMLADSDLVVLSEGATAVSTADALLAFADTVEFVPVADAEGTALANDANVTTLSDSEKDTAKRMGVSEESMLAAKIARESATIEEEG
jgi:hypothetical protein